MRFDLLNQVCAAQAFTGSATVSDFSIKKGSAAQDISIGRRMAFLCMPTVAQGAGSTMVIEAIQADNAALSTNVEALSSISVAAAAGVVGAMLEVPIPEGVITRQYLGIRVTLTSGTTTITLDAYLVPQDEIVRTKKTFPKVVGSAA